MVVCVQKIDDMVDFKQIKREEREEEREGGRKAAIYLQIVFVMGHNLLMRQCVIAKQIPCAPRILSANDIHLSFCISVQRDERCVMYGS